MIKKTLTIIILFANIAGSTQAQKLTNQRAKWFTDARFGMFIHWGLYSAAEGVWKGERLRNANDYAEWIFYRNRMDKQEYLSLLNRFVWEEIKPEKWVIAAKQAGMKYITITAKHHDGFALWNSKASDYNIYYHSNNKRDIIRELADACKKHGIKLCLYYSHWIDWEHQYGWNHNMELKPITNEQYNEYWQEKVIPQVTELLTNYGEISMLWFDMWINHSKTIVSKKQLLQLKKLIRKLQPNCLINSRLGLSIEEDPDIDYKTLGDNQLGNKKENFPWQSPGTVAHSWGFNSYENRWKSTSVLLKWLINNVSLNGNYMLNIGPRANGDIPYEIAHRLNEIGDWLKVNGESIYGAGAFDLNKNQHDWGKITCKTLPNGTTRLYLHLYNIPLNKKLFVTGINQAPKKAFVLSDTLHNALNFKHKDCFTVIDLPDKQHLNPYISVIVLEYDNYPQITDDLVAKTLDGGYSLTVENMGTAIGSTQLVKTDKYYGSIPTHIEVSKKSLYSWNIYVDKPKTLQVDISYSEQNPNSNGNFIIEIANQKIEGQFKPTGKLVVEPNINMHADNYKSFRAGNIKIDKAGIYTVKLSINPNKSTAKFQWIWINDN